MTVLYDDSNRQVMPRWYPFRTACQLGDIEPEEIRDRPKIESPQLLEQKIKAWLENHSIVFAVELVGTALMAGDFLNKQANEAATFILNSQVSPESLSWQIAEVYKRDRSIRGIDSISLSNDSLQHRLEIARLKKRLHLYPRNAIALADLAFHYTILGQRQKAEYCMNTAVSLGGNNRYILRSAARYFLHLGEPERSLFYLRRTPLAKTDPWIAAAEISLSEGLGRKADLIKPAQAMISNTNLSPWSLNELAATLSTLEIHHGSASKSKKLLSKALQQPSENTMAQAEWLKSALGWEVLKSRKTVLAMFEANARRSFRNADFEHALEYAKEWSQFQPFTSRPAILASYIAAICLQNDNEAIEIIERAKARSLGNFLLQNNHAFSLASVGRIKEAEIIIAGVTESTLTARDHTVLAATKGLLEFRKGNTSEGRVLYKKAISGFKKISDDRSAVIATFFWAREELVANTPSGIDALKGAKDLAEKYDIKELIKYAEILAKQFLFPF